MKGFHFLVWFLCVRGVRDTQCGFKLMSRRAAQKLFTSLHIDRWAFDVELLYIAQCLNMKLGEVAVRWQEIEGTVWLRVLASFELLFSDVFVIWSCPLRVSICTRGNNSARHIVIFQWHHYCLQSPRCVIKFNMLKCA